MAIVAPSSLASAFRFLDNDYICEVRLHGRTWSIATLRHYVQGAVVEPSESFIVHVPAYTLRGLLESLTGAGKLVALSRDEGHLILRHADGAWTARLARLITSRIEHPEVEWLGSVDGERFRASLGVVSPISRDLKPIRLISGENLEFRATNMFQYVTTTIPYDGPAFDICIGGPDLRLLSRIAATRKLYLTVTDTELLVGAETSGLTHRHRFPLERHMVVPDLPDFGTPTAHLRTQNPARVLRLAEGVLRLRIGKESEIAYATNGHATRVALDGEATGEAEVGITPFHTVPILDAMSEVVEISVYPKVLVISDEERTFVTSTARL